MRRWIGTPWASVTIPEKCATLFPRNEVVGESYRAASNNRHHNTSNYNSNNPQQRPTTLHLSFISIHFFFQIYFSNLFLLLHIFSDGNLTGFAMTGNSVAATVSQPKGFKHPLNIFIFVFFFKYKRMIICWRFCFRCFTARVLSEWEKFGNAAGGFRDSSGWFVFKFDHLSFCQRFLFSFQHRSAVEIKAHRVRVSPIWQQRVASA